MVDYVVLNNIYYKYKMLGGATYRPLYIIFRGKTNVMFGNWVINFSCQFLISISECKILCITTSHLIFSYIFGVPPLIIYGVPLIYGRKMLFYYFQQNSKQFFKVEPIEIQNNKSVSKHISRLPPRPALLVVTCTKYRHWQWCGWLP